MLSSIEIEADETLEPCGLKLILDCPYFYPLLEAQGETIEVVIGF